MVVIRNGGTVNIGDCNQQPACSRGHNYCVEQRVADGHVTAKYAIADRELKSSSDDEQDEESQLHSTAMIADCVLISYEIYQHFGSQS